MKIKLRKGAIVFDLVDKNGKSYNYHRFKSSKYFECDILLEVEIDSHLIPLVPRIKEYYYEEFTIDGYNPREAIINRAKDIGYMQSIDTLFP